METRQYPPVDVSQELGETTVYAQEPEVVEPFGSVTNSLELGQRRTLRRAVLLHESRRPGSQEIETWEDMHARHLAATQRNSSTC